MKRNIQKLAQQEYDLLIVGGGINGAASAWDATLRGLKVALLERADFGGATSSNSAKIAHSGVRYLQHADFKRMRESISERATLMQIAPHLIDVQPYLLPIYGHGIKGLETMTLYFAIYDLLSRDQRRVKDSARCIPNCQILSKQEVLKMWSSLDPDQLTGGAIWYEGQIHNTERLLLSYLLSASERGAEIANYVEVVEFIQSDNVVVGVEAKDLISGQTIKVRAKTVLNACGPWIVKTLNLSREQFKDYDLHASKAFSFITRPLTKDHAVVFPIKPMYRDPQAIVNKKSSLAFAIPWRGYSLVGSLHLPCEDDPERVSISEEEIQTYIELINEGYPEGKLRREDVHHVLWGIIPADREGSAAPMKHYRILDHATEDGLEGLVSVVGVKYTTSRDVAQKTIDLVFRKLGQVSPLPRTKNTPLWGGDIEYLDLFMNQAIEQESDQLSPEVVRNLVRKYGSAYQHILRYLDENPAWAQVLPNSDVIQAEVIHGVREEMAEKLVDVVFRRTDLGSAGYLGDEPLRLCAQLMARELGWNEAYTEAELRNVVDSYIIRPKTEVVCQP
ncbi:MULTISPECIES: glycerol-3-phosphate dehydrogenase/oxidase [unclassified Moorena]|uniref:glycerol-3-phosphate dehydrogenase/oxidase n=2 Tax=Moorena TaxID=1155738 RepID=UPI0013C0EC95|nr:MULTISPECIES: glycerol-3-phosphate dehydrogenase/oxidase [unclassified Moorena]NEP34882.1 glycerol-3-phosphate dehydrogenase/oxidase [Moorena sp. SIO3B2]NET64589.1 glycerol-3-phosphate dehydrogenase/oxidase [Moorena sp. SIO1G6]